MHSTRTLAALLAASALGVAAAPAAGAKKDKDGGAGAAAAPAGQGSGGAAYGVAPKTSTSPDEPTVPGRVAKLKGRIAYAPAQAPETVKRAIWAANEITTKPYRYGGGHASFKDSGYDCSGTISVPLNAAGVLAAPLDSSSFMSWGAAGAGRWITVYAHPGHAYAIIAGLRLDTSGPGERGPRWRPEKRSSSGFTVRHPVGL